MMRAVLVVVVVAMVVARIAAAPYKQFATACLDDQSWAATIARKHSGLLTAAEFATTEVYFDLGQVDDHNTCQYTVNSLRGKLTSNIPSMDRNTFSDDYRDAGTDAQFRQIVLDASYNELQGLNTEGMQMVWRFDRNDMILDIGVVSIDSDRPNEPQRDTFRATGNGCKSPLPLDFANTKNPRYQCMRLSLYPTSCEQKLGIGSTGQAYEMIIGRWGVISEEYKGHRKQRRESSSTETSLPPTKWSMGVVGKSPVMESTLRTMVGCYYGNEKFYGVFTPKSFGSDESDRSWRIISKPENERQLRGADLERVSLGSDGDVGLSFMEMASNVDDDDYNMFTDNVFGDAVDLERVDQPENYIRPPPGTHWCYRTARGELVSGGDYLVETMTDSTENPHGGALKRERDVLQVSVDVDKALSELLGNVYDWKNEDAATRAKINTLIKAAYDGQTREHRQTLGGILDTTSVLKPSQVRKFDTDVDLERQFSTPLSTNVDAGETDMCPNMGAMPAPDNGKLLVFTSRTKLCGWKKCTSQETWFGVESRDDVSQQREGWEELISEPFQLESREPARFCLAIRKVQSQKTQDQTIVSPCNLFRTLYTAGSERSSKAVRSLRNTVFVTLASEAGPSGTCDDATWLPSFSLALKQDLFARGSQDRTWRMAEPSGRDVAGQARSWAWRSSGDGFEISFRATNPETVNVFHAVSQCQAGSPKDSWVGGFVLSKGNSKQNYECMKLTMMPDACEHAIGIGSDTAAHVSFEASLASTLTLEGECEYIGSFRSFGMAFTNEPWHAPGKDATSPTDWKKVHVESGLVSHPYSWRWRTESSNVITIKFEVADNPEDLSKVREVEFQGSKPCAHGVYPDLKKDWELRSKNDDSFVCLKMSQNMVTTSAYFKQADLFEIVHDLSHNPFNTSQNSDELAFGHWAKKFEGMRTGNYEANKKEFATAFKDIKISKVTRDLTNEKPNLDDSMSHGFPATHTARLPLGHPLVKTGKVMHSHGMQTRALFIRNPRSESGYTGLFARDKVPVIVRYSPSNIDSAVAIHGWSIKFFRSESLPPDDLVLYHSFAPVSHCDALRERVSNVPVESSVQTPHIAPSDAIGSKFDPLKGYLMEKYAHGDEFGKKKGYEGVKPSAMRVGIAHLFLEDDDAWQVRDRHADNSVIPPEILERTKFPHALAFVPEPVTAQISREKADLTAANADNECARNRVNFMRKQLGAIKPHTQLFHVYEFNPTKDVTVKDFEPSAKKLLGSIVTEEPFIESWYGDSLLHFAHEPYDSDTMRGAKATKESASLEDESPTQLSFDALPLEPEQFRVASAGMTADHSMRRKDKPSQQAMEVLPMRAHESRMSGATHVLGTMEHP